MDNRIGYLVKRVQHGLRSAMDGVLGSKGLTTPKYSVLSALELEPGISNAELARRSFVTPQTMIRIVENLESLGLLARRAHPTHGKVLMATLTPAGAKLAASCHAEVSRVEARMLSHLGSEDRVNLQRMLEKCSSALEQS